METLNLLWGTVLLRPYVFIFFAIYLAIAVTDVGLVRSLAFTIIAFLFAFLSEYSSTRNGFPYGDYSYIDITRDQELWISNVPFMDSLSFSFLAYVSFTFSLLLWARLNRHGWDIQLVEDKELRRSWKVVLSGAIVFTLMDVIIDPVAFRGDRWFLGKIYYYAEKGEYFDIPLTNFGGWFLVGTIILFFYTRLEPILECWQVLGPNSFPGKALFGALLFAAFDAYQMRLQQVIGSDIPYQVFLMLPYIFSIVALILISRRVAIPQALMIPYRKGER